MEMSWTKKCALLLSFSALGVFHSKRRQTASLLDVRRRHWRSGNHVANIKSQKGKVLWTLRITVCISFFSAPIFINYSSDRSLRNFSQGVKFPKDGKPFSQGSFVDFLCASGYAAKTSNYGFFVWMHQHARLQGSRNDFRGVSQEQWCVLPRSSRWRVSFPNTFPPETFGMPKVQSQFQIPSRCCLPVVLLQSQFSGIWCYTSRFDRHAGFS